MADILWLHYFFVEILLCEVAVHDSIGSAGYSDFSMTRLKMLFTCLNSTKSFFEKWHASPTSAHFDFTYFPVESDGSRQRRSLQAMPLQR
jgi:hypothetical protein